MSKYIAVSAMLSAATLWKAAYRSIATLPVGRMPIQGSSNSPIKCPIVPTQTVSNPSIWLCPAKNRSRRRCRDVSDVLSGTQNRSATGSLPMIWLNG